MRMQQGAKGGGRDHAFEEAANGAPRAYIHAANFQDGMIVARCPGENPRR
jgi:hypothetical protein